MTRFEQPLGERTINPVRIDRIGTDQITVTIRPIHHDADRKAAVARLEQLVDAGFDTIYVVVDSAPHTNNEIAVPAAAQAV